MIAKSSRPIVAPHTTAWTAEEDLPYSLITIPGVGIGYADEIPADRDRNGILWCRAASKPGEGHPDFGRVHPPPATPRQTTAPSSQPVPSPTSRRATMDSFDLITELDETIDRLVEPLLTGHVTGDPKARELALDLGLHLLDRGCSIVARAGLDLAGLDIAIVAAQDRAHGR